MQISGDAGVVQQIDAPVEKVVGQENHYRALLGPLTAEQRADHQNRQMLIKDTRRRVEETRASALALSP